MASWWLTRISWPRISPGRALALDQDLRGRDSDFGFSSDRDIVGTYADGIRGLWRSPLIRETELRDVIRSHRIEPDAWHFAPAKCLAHLDPEAIHCAPCLCRTDPTYGCNMVTLEEAERAAGLAARRG